MDFDGVYAAYFDKENSWACWEKEHPRAKSWVQISKPAFDSDSGLVLIYIEILFGMDGVTEGSGFVEALWYENDSFRFADNTLMWMT